MIAKTNISFVIPARNASRTILRCINSILEITDFKVEILVVCNNCNDNTYELIKNYKEKNNLETMNNYCKNDVSGASEARNFGIEQAIGDWICFVDADDYIDANFLSQIYRNNIKFHGADMAIGTHWVIKSDHVKLYDHGMSASSLMRRREIIVYLKDYCAVPYFYTLFVHCWGKLYLRNKIIDQGIRFDGKLIQLEDVNFNLQYLAASKDVFFENIPTYHYDATFNPVSLSLRSGSEINAVKNIYKAIKPIKKILETEVPKINMRVLIAQLVTSVSRIWMIRVSRNAMISSVQASIHIQSILDSKLYQICQVRYTPKCRDSRTLNVLCKYSNSLVVIRYLFFKSGVGGR